MPAFPPLFSSRVLAQLCCGVLFTSLLHAQSPASTGLSLTEALRRAVERNPSLLAAAHGERAADALVEQAATKPIPTLEVSLENMGGTGRAQGVRGIEATVQASQTFERGGKREQRIALARRDREATTADYAVRRSEVLVATALAYTDVLTAQRRVTFAEEAIALAREMLTAVEARVAAGAASPAESARARAALGSARADLAREEAGLHAARATLAAQWAGDAADVAALTPVVARPITVPPVESYLAAIDRHPRLELQRRVMARQSSVLALEQTRSTADLTASGGVRFLGEGSDAALVAGLSIPLPGPTRNAGAIRAARATLTGAEQTLRAIEAELRTAVTAAWQQAHAAQRVAATLRSEALPATEEAYAVVRRAYQAGELPLIDVLDAQRALSALHREIADAEAAGLAGLVRTEAIADPSFPRTTALLSSP